MRTSVLLALTLLAFAPRARAEDDPWIGVEDAAKKRGAGATVLVIVGKTDGEEAKAARTALADKRVTKALAGATVTRIDPADEDAAKRFALAPEKGECAIALDGYGLAAGKHEKSLTVDSLLHLLKQAEEATAKKKKVEKGLDAAVARGEGALKKEDPKTACEQFAGVAEYAATVPCGAVTKAKKELEALTAKGLAALEEVRAALGKDELAKARKLLAAATATYPIAEVQTEGKKVRDELGAAEASHP